MNDEKEIQIIGAPDKTIPKFATRVVFNKLPHGDVVLSFMVQSAESAPAALIETIMVDAQHAKRIAEKLTGMTKDV